MTAAILPTMKAPLRQSYAAKLLQTQGIVSKWIRAAPLNKQAVGFSGGKDSTLVLSFVLNTAKTFCRDTWQDLSVVFCNTGVEYPETVQFVHDLQKKWKFTLIELKPEKTFWACIKEDGHYPQGKSVRGADVDTCCDWLKERPMKQAIKERGWEILYDGITALESRNRMIRGAIDGTCHFAQRWNIQKVHPILYWSEAEVWQHTKEMYIPANPVYSMGAKRCGCMTCTAHIGWKEELGKLKPKMLRKILRDMGQQQLGDAVAKKREAVRMAVPEHPIAGSV